MGHTIIILIFIVFVLGLWTISYLYYIRKEYYYHFISSFIGIIIAHNVMLCVDLIRTYLAVNIVRNEEVFRQTIFSKLSQPLVSFLTFIVLFLLIRLLFQISDRKVHPKVVWVSVSVVILYTLSYLARFVSISLSSDLLIVRDIHFMFEFATANGVYLLLFFFSAENIFWIKDPVKRYIAVLSTFYLAFLLLCSFPLVQSKPLYLYYMSLLMSVFNVFPLIWMKYFFLPYSLRGIISDDISNALNTLLREKKITAREKEIAELILRGKSNKEIEEELFISVSTVKNHIYRLFKRLGIKSRGQLVNLLLERRSSKNK